MASRSGSSLTSASARNFCSDCIAILLSLKLEKPRDVPRLLLEVALEGGDVLVGVEPPLDAGRQVLDVRDLLIYGVFFLLQEAVVSPEGWEDEGHEGHDPKCMCVCV